MDLYQQGAEIDESTNFPLILSCPIQSPSLPSPRNGIQTFRTGGISGSLNDIGNNRQSEGT